LKIYNILWENKFYAFSRREKQNIKRRIKRTITDNCIEELMITKQHIDELKDTVSELQSEIDKYKDLLQRKQAEFINFKKRVTIEKENLSKYAIEKLIEELLPVVDGLEKAIEHLKQIKA
jgi:molecular chaperone GrpE